MSFSIELYSKLREQNFIDVDGVPRSNSGISSECLDAFFMRHLISPRWDFFNPEALDFPYGYFGISRKTDIPLEMLYASAMRVQQRLEDEDLFVKSLSFHWTMQNRCYMFLKIWRELFRCRLPSKPFSKPSRQIRHQKSMKRVVKLPGFINNHKISALPDTGAARNMMSASYARKHKIPILQGSEHRRSFKLANGKTVRSRGVARVTWAFNDRQDKTYDLEFHILADCPCDVLIGAKFLQDTETLSLHRHRLKKCKVSTRDIRFVNLCGSPSQVLLGLLNSESISALPDTGSEVNLISEKYARDHEFIINTDDDSRGLLQFADGTTQEALGQVTAQWAFRDDFDNPINVTFEVLAECAYDVILGHEILYQHEAYVKHRTCLIDVEVEAENQGKLRLNLVGWLPRCLHRIKRKQDRDTTADANQIRKAKINDELTRRALATLAIDKIEDPTKKEARRRAERLREQSWDRN